MTVAELIAELQKLPQDLPVCVFDETTDDVVVEAADEIASLRARVEVITGALEKLIVTVEFEVPPIRDGVDVDHRLDVLAMSAREARQALKDTPDAE